MMYRICLPSAVREMPVQTLLHNPLTDAELDRLSDFLDSCPDDSTMNLEELDGFLAALIVGSGDGDAGDNSGDRRDIPLFFFGYFENRERPVCTHVSN